MDNRKCLWPIFILIFFIVKGLSSYHSQKEEEHRRLVNSPEYIAQQQAQREKEFREKVLSWSKEYEENLQRTYIYKNEPDGFRGIKWGTDISTLKGMICTESHPDHKLYIRKEEKLQMEGAKLANISYGFYKDKFYSVGIVTYDWENFRILKEDTFKKFGNPRFWNKDFGEWYLWVGNSTTLNLKYDEDLKSGYLLLVYLNLLPAEMRKEMRQAIEELEKGAETRF